MGVERYVIGVDYGTDSVRSVIIDTADGREISHSVFNYPRWAKGMYCAPAQNRFRQHPLDYIEGLEHSITDAISKAPAGCADRICGISIDTTGSTPVAVDKAGTPLSLTKGFEDDPDAMFILWKDHTSIQEASDINDHSRGWGGTDFTRYVGGIYSSEWFWAKMLHVLRTNAKVGSSAFSWVEHCDWMTGVLTGITDPLKMKRSRCAAGHKAMWHSAFGGLPSEEYLTALDPLLKGIRSRLFDDTFTSDVAAGTLCPEWAKRLGLNDKVVVGVGAFDAHMGAVGAQIEPYYLSKVMGTSTCDMLIAPTSEIGDKVIRGICGQVDGSIIPGMLGMEAGQSAFGDVYAWFKRIMTWPLTHVLQESPVFDEATRGKIIHELSSSILPAVEKEAAKIPIGDSAEIALDWFNGRRTPDADQSLTGVIAGLNLGSDAPRLYRALVESTAFGAKKIVDRFESEGIPIKGVIALGGVAKKSSFVMQTVADVFNKKIKVARSDQACALGAAMFAAVAAGVFPTVSDAQKTMGNGFEKEYSPDAARSAAYAKNYARYSKLATFFEKEGGEA